MGTPGREGRVEGIWAGLPIAGVSVAGRETWFRLPTLGLAFDLGRCPTELVSVPNVFLSHAHLDHGAGLAYWMSQRRLLRLPAGVVWTEPSAVERWRRLVALHEELEGVRYDARVEPANPGEAIEIRKDLAVRPFRVEHRIPALGFVALEVRTKLVPGFRGKGEEAVRAAVARGETVAEKVERPVVAFSGDTAAGFFDLAPKEAFRAKVLLLECSFVEGRDAGRSKEWGHLHLDEIAARADLFENEVLVLTHLTLRTPPDEIRREIARRLPAGLANRTVPFLPA